jgi:amino acid adenylation domain-containing protein
MSSAALSGAPPGVTSPEQELIRRLGDGTAFVSIGAWRIAAPNRSTIQKALAELTERHHVLRPAEASNPVLAVEWREWMPDNGDPEPLIRAMFDEIRAAASAGNIRSPLRAVVAATEPERSVLALAAPATCADRRGLRNIAAEIAAFCSGRISGTPGPALQYDRYAAVRRELLKAPESGDGRRYWTARALKDAPCAMLLGKTHPQSPVRFAPRTLYRRLAEALLPAVKLARSQAVSLDALLLATYHALLWRLGANPQVLTGVGFDGRQFDVLRDLPGTFERHVPVRSYPGERVSAAELMRQIQGALSEVGPWVDQFDWTYVRDAGPQSAPLCYQFGFSWFEAVEAHAVPMLEYSSQDRFDLNLTCSDYAGHVQMEWQYNSSVYSKEDASRIARCWENLLHSFCRYPNATLADLEIVDTAVPLRVPAVDIPGDDACIHERIEAQAKRTPDAPAVVSSTGSSLTYRELENRASDLARCLQTLSVGPERTVAVVCERSPALIVGILAVLKAGGAYVPIDPRTPPQRLRFMLRDASVCAVLSEQDLLQRIPAGSWPVISIDAAGTRREPGSLVRRAVPDNIAYVIYTSGSTGTPKGVAVSHRNLVSSTTARHAFYPEGVTCFLLLSSAAFDSSVAGIFGTLTQGGVLLLGPADFPAGLSELPETIQRNGVSHLLCLPTVWAEILDRAPVEALSCLRCVIVAGEPCPSTLIERHVAALPSIPLVNEYGPTECTVWSTAGVLSGKPWRTPVGIGRPIRGTRVYVLNSSLRGQPAGVAGELCIGGDGVARGYLNRPELTAEKFIPDPYAGEPGARMYRSGDRALLLDDGEIRLLGRVDDQIKIRGHRIEPAEIESAVRTHPAIREAVVVAHPDGSRNPRLAAYFIPSTDQQIADIRRDLPAYLRERLPDYMVPSTFVPLERLPVNLNGKVDRRALPDPEPEIMRGPHTALDGDIEKRVASLWSEILKTEVTSSHDNFFDLGGHSLLAVRLHERLCQEFDTGIRLIDLFEHATVNALARFLARRTESSASAADGDVAWAANRRVALARQRAQATAAE